MGKNIRKSGFSIVEVVIALAIVVSVTFAALSLVISSVTSTVNAIHMSKAQSFAGNVWECFKAAENEEEFLALVSFAEGVTLADGTTDENGNTAYTHILGENRFTAEITVCFPENAQAELTVTVTDKDEDGFFSFSYRKGDGI